jgi:hypothetical protein
MELMRHTFPNWFVWLLIVVPIAMMAVRGFRDMERKNRETNEAVEKEIEQREASKRAREEYERERRKVRGLHKLGWRTAAIANELKLSTDRVRLDVRSEDTTEISMVGAAAAMRELQDIASDAKARLQEQDRPIVQADVEELLHMLSDAQQRIDVEMDTSIAKSVDGGSIFSKSGRGLIGSRSELINIGKASSLPQAIIDLTLAAANNDPRGRKCCMN